MKKKSVLLLAIFTVVLLGCVHTPGNTGYAKPDSVLRRIVERGEIVVGTTGKQPPLNGTGQEGKVIGLEADLVRMMAEGLGVRATFQTMPFHELLPSLKAGKVDMVLSGMTMTLRRNLEAAFAGPYFVTGKSFVTKAQTIASVKDVSQINRPETVLAALKGSTSQTFVEKRIPQAKLILTEDHQQALQLVLEDKVHAMIADHHLCVLSVLLFSEQKLVTLEKPLTYEPVGIALPANDPLMLNLVENLLSAIQESGELEKLKERWFRQVFGDKETLRDSLEF